jgi:hypothetical protein
MYRGIDNIFGINFMLRLYCKEQLQFDNVLSEILKARLNKPRMEIHQTSNYIKEERQLFKEIT